MTCKYCGSTNVKVQPVAEAKKRGCLASCAWFIIGLCTCGLIWIIPLLTKKGSKTKTYAVCQDCGKKWRVL